MREGEDGEGTSGISPRGRSRQEPDRGRGRREGREFQAEEGDSCLKARRVGGQVWGTVSSS